MIIPNYRPNETPALRPSARISRRFTCVVYRDNIGTVNGLLKINDTLFVSGDVIFRRQITYEGW